MAQCPKCSAPITDDFGLIECPSCRTQLLVQMDGSVEQASAEPAEQSTQATVTEAEPTDGEAVDIGAAFDEPYEDLPFESSAELSDDSAAEPDEMYVSEDEYEGTSPEADEEPIDFGEPTRAEPAVEPEADAYPDFDQPEDDPAGADAYVSPASSPDLSDLAAFGNSDVSSAREGALRYNVRVTGIDTADVRDAFREALTDRKFVWDTDQILRSIRDGECVLNDVTATKAHVLISRLRTLPVEIEWDQYAIHQA